ncbi:twin-arginine translocase TatA/TatE family subunit [Ferrovibrio sp.]|uniref:twin-arginine translocase TatA/TatE family subunit n=1 Tax=Ferrovibrio sp. TaxID=1917215 RepID=UPI0025BE2C57|nr:twin-arginine translocase TatA/TatE family subunit [Ferrovibrio sp.]MBX3454322.1 twin-arginine translocase TatA/TatE family subunit [Ferrovibrio sp.]
MGSFSIWHWLLVLVVILILFGAGKLPKVAGDLASGIKNFRKGMKEEPGDEAKDSATIQQQTPPPAPGANQGSSTGANAGEKH